MPIVGQKFFRLSTNSSKGGIAEIKWNKTVTASVQIVGFRRKSSTRQIDQVKAGIFEVMGNIAVEPKRWKVPVPWIGEKNVKTIRWTVSTTNGATVSALLVVYLWD